MRFFKFTLIGSSNLLVGAIRLLLAGAIILPYPLLVFCFKVNLFERFSILNKVFLKSFVINLTTQKF